MFVTVTIVAWPRHNISNSAKMATTYADLEPGKEFCNPVWFLPQITSMMTSVMQATVTCERARTECVDKSTDLRCQKDTPSSMLHDLWGVVVAMQSYTASIWNVHGSPFPHATRLKQSVWDWSRPLGQLLFWMFTIQDLANLWSRSSKNCHQYWRQLSSYNTEYVNQVWHPRRLQDVDKVEEVQKKAKKIIIWGKKLTYENRLRKLKLPTLTHRKVWGDMIDV